MSSAVPSLFKGCFSAFDALFSSLLIKSDARGLSVKEGAIALTLIFGANSAAKLLIRPSIAPFEIATWLWKLKPFCTATVENATMDASWDLRKFEYAF